MKRHHEQSIMNKAGAANGTDGERGTNSDAVTGPYGEKYGTDSKNMTSVTKNFLVDGL